MDKLKKFLTSRQVCARYGDVSSMSLWRWCNDAELGFPQPVRINRIRFWDEAELNAFDARASGEMAVSER